MTDHTSRRALCGNKAKYAFALLAAAAMLAPVPAMAKPAKKGVLMTEQPDGSQLPIRLMGDEHAHRVFSEDGYLLAPDKNGVYCYATVDAKGDIIASDVRATSLAARPAKAAAFLKSLNKNDIIRIAENADNSRREVRMQKRVAAIETTRGNVPQRKPCSQGMDLLFSDFPSTGSPKALVVLVEYADVKFTHTDPHDYFTRMITEEGFSDYGSIGSAEDYFKLQSQGKFTPDFDVYGPVTLPRNRSYYGGNDYGGNDMHPEQMSIDALDILDDEVDFSVYDTDGDGYIDNVYIFYAGKGEADGGGASTVWPHSWNVTYGTSVPHIYDGVRLDRYACSNEWDNTARRPDGIGTFVHEFSHVMGLPDLYATTYTNSFTPGEWSCLDYGPYNNGGLTPPNYSIFERYSLGWMEPSKFYGNVTDAPYSLTPVTENQGYLVQTNNDKEFFLIEFRQMTGFDEYIPNTGMLVWRIDYDQQTWTRNQVNNTPSRQRVDIIEADNIKSDYSRQGDCFPGSRNVTSFTENTIPSFTTRLGRTVNVEFNDIMLTADGRVAFNATHNLPEAVGVDEIISNGEGLNVAVNGRVLNVESETAVRVINLAGMTVATVEGNGSVNLPAAGMYIITTGTASTKVMVK